MNLRVPLCGGLTPIALALVAAACAPSGNRDHALSAQRIGSSVLPQSSYNPIIKKDEFSRPLFTADPGVLVDGDTLYVYAGHDEATVGGWFNIREWVSFSTKDMRNWTYHGPVMKSTDFSWATDGTAWAAQVIRRNGKYYLYSTSGRPDRKGYTLGVAVADKPLGPFVDAIGKPLLDNALTTGGPVDSIEDIDPTVFVDDDGQAYLYWGNGTLHYALLNDDMISIKDLNGDGKIIEGQDVFSKVQIENIRSPYGEAPWLFKNEGKYYLVWASGLPQKVAYAMADNPRGPWRYAGVILDENLRPDGSRGDFNSDTSHPAVVFFKGQLYVFYHTAALPTGGQGRRSVAVEKARFNADGTIALSHITSTGITGTSVRIRSAKDAGRQVVNDGFGLKLAVIKDETPASAWELLSGLAQNAGVGSVSIQSVGHPGYYWKLEGEDIVLAKHDGTEAFERAATFIRVPGLADPARVSFRSLLDTTRYVRVVSSGDKLMGAKIDSFGTVDDKQDATFSY